MKYFQIIIIILFLFSSPSSWPMGSPAVERTKYSLIGKPAPDVILSQTDGTTAGVLGPQRGKKVILFFWATWCPHCYEELSSINDNFETIENKGFKIILVDVGESKEDMKNYFKQRQLHLTSFIDQDSYLTEAYHLQGVPTIIFIDEKGIIRNMSHVFPSDYENYFTSN